MVTCESTESTDTLYVIYINHRISLFSSNNTGSASSNNTGSASSNNTGSASSNNTGSASSNNTGSASSNNTDIIIDTATVGGNNFANGQVIGPSAQNPLFFHFMSDDSFSYICKIVRIEEDAFNQILDQQNANMNLDNVTEISRDPCGTGTDGSIQYAQSFASGLFAFQVVGITAGGLGTEATFLFETQAGQAGPGGPPGVTKAMVSTSSGDLSLLTRPCDQSVPPTYSAKLVAISYDIEGSVDWPVNMTVHKDDPRPVTIEFSYLDQKVSFDTGWGKIEFIPSKVVLTCEYKNYKNSANLPGQTGVEITPIFSDCAPLIPLPFHRVEGKFTYDYEKRIVAEPGINSIKIGYKIGQDGSINGYVSDGTPHDFTLDPNSSYTFCSTGPPIKRY